jgi:hypothetical protein
MESVAVAGMIRRKTVAFTMRMDPEVRAAAEQAAANDRRSLAAYIEMLMIEDGKRRGLLTPEGRLEKITVEKITMEPVGNPRRRKRAVKRWAKS